MKKLKRTGVYKASNVTFDPATCQAYSYGWWRFVDRIGGKVVFNGYRYSVSTAAHQRKIKELLETLGIHIDLEIEAPLGLQAVESALTLYTARIATLTAEIRKPGTRKSRNLERAAEIREIQRKIGAVKSLGEASHA